MARLSVPASVLIALVLTSATLYAEPQVQALLVEFTAVNWDLQARAMVGDLADNAWLTRVRAEHALVGMGGEAVSDLIAALDSPNRHLRALVARRGLDPENRSMLNVSISPFGVLPEFDPPAVRVFRLQGRAPAQVQGRCAPSPPVWVIHVV